jgi:hypothetical protein
MKRILIVGAFATIAFLILRPRVSKLRERLEARCEAMFEQMPNTFPPKKMMRGIDEIQVTTGRILQLVENPTKVADEPVVAKRPEESIAARAAMPEEEV